MIPIEDLRIGNIVNTPICPGKIIGIDKDKYWPTYYVTICSSNCEFRLNINNIHPIQITTEILLKSGFKYIKHTYTDDDEHLPEEYKDVLLHEEIFIHEHGDSFYIVQHQGEYSEYRFCQDLTQDYAPSMDYRLIARIRDIHELQNLYTDLLQKEINIII